MRLLLRVNAILIPVLALSAIGAGTLIASLVRDYAQHEALREATLIMDSALAAREYTANEIVPLLDYRMQNEFLPQSVPYYAATQHILKLREQHPGYSYKEATLNPTNPRDRATDWESDIVQQFRNDSSAKEISGLREGAMGRVAYLARPIRTQAECMSCHSMAAVAPSTLLARYGSNNGFGWQPDEVIGAQLVSIPYANVGLGTERIVQQLLWTLIGVLLLVLLLVNLILYVAAVRPASAWQSSRRG